MDQAAVKRWLAGHRAAERRAREIRAIEGPRVEQAVAESLSAVNAACDLGIWPGPRDPISEAGVKQLRRRWAKGRGVPGERGRGERRIGVVLPPGPALGQARSFGGPETR